MNQVYNIGILFADRAQNGLTHDYFAGIINGFKKSMEEAGHNIVFLNCCPSPLNRETLLMQSRRLKLNGILISCIEYDDPQVLELLNSDIPMITVDEELPNIPAIKSDNIKGIQKLVHYIAEMGHKKIAYILGDSNTVTSIRLKSFYEACDEMGIQIPDTYIRHSKYRDMDKAAYETEQLLRLKNPPTCILYPDDFAAIGGINILHARGLDIPQDISVAGYDGIRILSQYEPRLTTVRQDTEEIGRRAAQRLMEEIAAPDDCDPAAIVVDTVLEPGRTVGQVYEY